MRTAAVVVAAALAASAGPARADDLPSGMFGAVFGVRQGTGPVTRQFGFGALWGMEAGWQPMTTQQRIGWSIKWRTLFSGFWSNEPANLTNELRVLEMDAGVGIRITPKPGSLRYLDLGGGAALMRSNVPLLPDSCNPPIGCRAFYGPYASAGLEQFVSGNVMLTFEIRVGLIGTGPATLSAITGVKFGV
jgi:hypothetical protein